jgi:hypothetical protein
MDMKKMVQMMKDQDLQPEVLNESATLTVTADNAEQVAQLLGIMKNAGLDHAKPVGGDMPLPKSSDDTKFRPGAAEDDPNIPGRDDVEGDQDLNQGLLGTIAGGALGAGLGMATGAGPMATTLGALSGAAAGDSLTDGGNDDPNIPGKDDVVGDQDLQAGIVGGVKDRAVGTATGGGLGAALGGAAGAGIAAATGGDVAQGAKAGAQLGGVAGGAMGYGAGADKAAAKELNANANDDPNIPGKDDVEGDQDLQAGVLDSLAGLAGQAGDAIAQGAQTVAQSDIGQAIGGVVDAAGETGADLGRRAADAAVDTLGPERIAQLAGQGDTYQAARDLAGSVPDVMGARDAALGAVDANVASQAADKGAELGRTAGKGLAVGGGVAAGAGAAKALGGDDDEKKESGYANEPDEEFSDQEKMIHDMSGGMNREKKQYKAAQRGDNAMSTESIKARLMAALAEKKQIDRNGDGKNDWEDVKLARKAAAAKAEKKKEKKNEAVTESTDFSDMMRFHKRLNG